MWNVDHLKTHEQLATFLRNTYRQYVWVDRTPGVPIRTRQFDCASETCPINKPGCTCALSHVQGHGLCPDLFTRGLLLIPINMGGSHWVVLCVHLKRHHIYFLDSLVAGRTRWPYDTAGGLALERLTAFLDWYHHASHGVLRTSPWSVIHVTVPQQGDGINCGVFTCAFIEALATGRTIINNQGEAVFDFDHGAVAYFRRRILHDISTLRYHEEEEYYP